MVLAQRASEDTYTPMVDGKALDCECNSVQITLKNLNELLAAPPGGKGRRRSVVSVYSVEGNVLIVFDTGETYLATGFRLGSAEEETHQLALFIAKHLYAGEHADLLFAQCQVQSPTLTGPIKIEPRVNPDGDSAILAIADTQEIPVRTD